MRLAIPSDIDGNPLVLDAVLADIQSQGEVDAYWCWVISPLLATIRLPCLRQLPPSLMPVSPVVLLIVMW